MKHIYFQLIDISKDCESRDYAYYGRSPINCDLAGWITSMAYHNKSSISDIRLFIYPTKKQWDDVRTEWMKRVRMAENQ